MSKLSKFLDIQKVIQHWTGSPAALKSPNWEQLWNDRWNQHDFSPNPVLSAELRFFVDSLPQDIKKPDSANEALALILAADQWPRIDAHDHANAYALDSLAQETCTFAISKQFHFEFDHPLKTTFLLSPLLNAEDISLQKMAILLFKNLKTKNPFFDVPLQQAIHNHDVLEQFGRFPERNRALDRTPSSKEMEYVNQLLKS